MPTHKNEKCKSISLFKETLKQVVFESLESFLKFWVGCVLKPKCLILASRASRTWLPPYLSPLSSHSILPSSRPLAPFWESSMQSRVPSCSLPLPQILGVDSFSSFSSLFSYELLKEALLISYLKKPSPVLLGSLISPLLHFWFWK